MAKLELADITSGYAAPAKYNNNNTLIEQAIENTISRDGTSPNGMEADLDLNGNKIVNLAAPINNNDAARLADIQAATTGITSANLILISDADGHYTGANVEAALDEIGDNINTIEADIANGVIPFYATTTGESGVTVVNSRFKPGCVDRYGTNTTPGTTDMTAAFNAAFIVARQFNCQVTFGDTAPYRLNSPVDATQLRGTTVVDTSGRNVGAAQVSLIIGHTGHGFDCSHSNETAWYDITATSVSGTTPTCVWFFARNAAASSAELHKFYRCRTPSNCTFTQIIYNYAAEELSLIDCFFYNGGNGSTVLNLNSTNPSGYTSTFQTIATGAQSNTVFNLFGTSLLNAGNSGSANESCIQMEQAGDFTMIGGLLACFNGGAYIRMTGAARTCNKFVMKGVRGEPAGTKPPRGISCETTGTTGVNAHVGWSIEDCSFTLSGSGFGVFLGDEAEVLDLRLTNNQVDTGNLLRAKFLSDSYIRHRSLACSFVAAGTVTRCTFDGSRAQLTFSGTDTLNQGLDTATGYIWQTADQHTSASTACTGAIVASAQYRIYKQGRQVTLILPSINAVATAAPSFVIQPAIPAAYRPTETLRVSVQIRDNGATPNQTGVCQITTAGVITILKDPAGANFTAAAGAGLADATPITFSQ